MGTNLLIWLTRFWTNGFQSFVMPCIQKSGICESVKHLGGSSVILVARHSVTFFISLANNSTENSSSLGIVCNFKGETCILATTKLEHLPTHVISTRYMTAAYAMADASQNLKSWYCFT